MLRSGVINGQLASVLARFRHMNSIAIVDGPFPSYQDVELVDLAIQMGTPKVSDVLDAILPNLIVTQIVMANEFKEKVDPATVKRYLSHNRDFPVSYIAHEDFKKEVGKTMAIIHTGDDVPYSSVILKSG